MVGRGAPRAITVNKKQRTSQPFRIEFAAAHELSHAAQSCYTRCCHYYRPWTSKFRSRSFGGNLLSVLLVRTIRQHRTGC